MHSKELFSRVFILKNEGKSLDEISRFLLLPKSTVQYMLNPKPNNKYKEPGRPIKDTRKRNKVIKEAVRKLKLKGERVTARKIRNNTRLDTSLSTIRRDLSSSNYQYKNIQRKIILSTTNKENRMAIATSWINDAIDFKNCIFSDEKIFRLDGPTNLLSWQKDNEKCSRNMRVARGGGIMVHGCIGNSGYLRIEKIDGNLNSDKYIDIMKNQIASLNNSYNNFSLVQDNCRIHTSAKVRQFFQESGVNILQWPPYSPDLNIIENVWGMMTEIIYSCYKPRTIAELWTAIKDSERILNGEKKDDIINLYEGFGNRIRLLFENHGDLIN